MLKATLKEADWAKINEGCGMPNLPKIAGDFLAMIGKGKEKVTPLGLEPRMSEPKSEVLPLHHGVMWAEFILLFQLLNNRKR